MENENSNKKNILNSQAAEKVERNGLDVQKKDQPPEQMKSQHISEDSCKNDDDNRCNDLVDKMKESRVLESKAQGEKLDDNVKQYDSGKINDSGNLNSKAQVEKLDDKLGKMSETRDSESKKVENHALGKEEEGRDLKSKSQGEQLDDKFGNTDENRDLKSNSQGEKLDNKLGQMDESRASESKKVENYALGKVEESRDLNNKSRGEKLGIKLDKMDDRGASESKKVENDGLGKVEENRDLKSKSQGAKFDNKLGKVDESGDLKYKSQGEKLDDKVSEIDESRDLKSKSRGEMLDGNLGKINESRDLKSESQGEKFANNMGKIIESDLKSNSQGEMLDDKFGKIDESRDLNSKSQGEKLDDNLGKVNESRDLKSKSQGEKLDDNLGKINESRNLKSKSQGEKLDSNLGKIDVSSDLECRSQGEKLDNNLGKIDESRDMKSKSQGEKLYDKLGKMDESRDLGSKSLEGKSDDKNKPVDSVDKKDNVSDLDLKARAETNQNRREAMGEEEKEQEPIFDGTEVPGMEANRSASSHPLDPDSEAEGSVWPEKAVAIKNFVKEKGVVAVSTVLRHLSGKKDENGQEVSADKNEVTSESSKDSEAAEASQKMTQRSLWNPLNYIMMSSDVNGDNKAEQTDQVTKEPLEPLVMKGRIILYTRLGCKDCKEVRLHLHQKRLGYVEINIDIYPGRKLELEKIAGSSAVPKVFFNEILIGGLSELKDLDESGKLDGKINYLITETPSFKAPLPPLSGEDDMSSSGAIDELALVVFKMKESVVVKDRFYKMRRFTSCFLGSDAVNFLSEDQYLERDEAVEFGRKLAGKLFFQHVLDENLFEDGNHLYRFLDHDPIVSSQCHNIPTGLIDAKPKPITEIASRLRYLSYAIFEAYVSEDGKQIDYRSIHGSEEFARYLRTVQELQRVELESMPREEKLAFFINLYNMMVIHAILLWGHPAGPLDRRKMFGDFRYVIGGCTYSLSAIQNGILRGNQRPPYNLMKTFGAKDKRSQVALPYPEPLTHFALVCGTRSGPALRCYSPGNIDKELMEAARDFLRGGGCVIDVQGKVASVSKILKWFSVDFGKNEMEVLKHASNYLEPTDSETLLELLSNSQLKVIYQPYDWASNS